MMLTDFEEKSPCSEFHEFRDILPRGGELNEYLIYDSEIKELMRLAKVGMELEKCKSDSCSQGIDHVEQKK